MNNHEIIDRTINLPAVDKSNIVAMYRYGSRVYGTNTPASDHDIIVVHKGKTDSEEIRRGDLNVHIYEYWHWLSLLDDHKVFALECQFLPREFVLIENEAFKFQLVKEKIRREFAAKASNSWVKCKKKLADGEILIGRKSLFHSLRIINFAIQIAELGKIEKYDAENDTFYEIMAMIPEWGVLKDRFQPVYNSQSSRLRALIPLND